MKRFQDGEKHAVEALAWWIGHPAVQPVIERRRVGAETVIAPIRRLLADHKSVAWFCWDIFGIAAVGPDWQRRRSQPWMLTPGERSVIDRVESDFKGVVEVTINELVGAGVGLVPGWPGDKVIVGELRPTSPRSGVATSTTCSGRRSARPMRTAANARCRSPPRRRREALRQVLDRWPNATASTIWTTFADHGVQRGGQARTPDGYLRQLLEADRPDIAADLARQATERRQSPPEPGRRDQLEEESARLRQENRQLREQIEAAAAVIQRITLENHELRQEVEAAAKVTRLGGQLLPQPRQPVTDPDRGR